MSLFDGFLFGCALAVIEVFYLERKLRVLRLARRELAKYGLKICHVCLCLT